MVYVLRLSNKVGFKLDNKSEQNKKKSYHIPWKNNGLTLHTVQRCGSQYTDVS